MAAITPKRTKHLIDLLFDVKCTAIIDYYPLTLIAGITKEDHGNSYKFNFEGGYIKFNTVASGLIVRKEFYSNDNKLHRADDLPARLDYNAITGKLVSLSWYLNGENKRNNDETSSFITYNYDEGTGDTYYVYDQTNADTNKIKLTYLWLDENKLVSAIYLFKGIEFNHTIFSDIIVSQPKKPNLKYYENIHDNLTENQRLLLEMKLI